MHTLEFNLDIQDWMFLLDEKLTTFFIFITSPSCIEIVFIFFIYEHELNECNNGLMEFYMCKCIAYKEEKRQQKSRVKFQIKICRISNNVKKNYVNVADGI